MMAQSQSSIFSSSEANHTFKTKVGDSLSLLRFLNDEDKNDIWKFWKTITSAVKIAVSGKGDAASVTNRSRTLDWQNRESDYLCVQNLEENATAIYLPLKMSTIDSRKYRILKMINEKTITDYELTLPKQLEEIDTYKGITEGQETLCNGPDKTLKIDINHGEISQKLTSLVVVVDNLKNQNDVPSNQEIAQHQSVPSNNAKEQSQRKRKTIIWPISRAATRSMSKSQSLQVASNNSNQPNETVSTEINNTACISKEQFHHEPITIECPLTSNKSDQEEYGVTILPIRGYGEIQIVNDGQNKNVKASHTHSLGQESEQNDGTLIHLDVDVNVKCNQESSVCERMSSIRNEFFPSETNQEMSTVFHSVDSGGNFSTCSLPISNLQPIISNNIVDSSNSSEIVQIKIEESGGLERASHQIGLDEIKADVHGLHEVHIEGHLKDKTTSDIETIISALEAELKKNGSEVGSISITSDKDGTAEIVTGPGDQIVQLIPGQEMVEIKSGDDMIWSSGGGDVHVTGPPHAVVETSTAAASQGAFMEEGSAAAHMDSQYDVVEYEIFADKEKISGNAGRKKKDKSNCQEKDVLDRTCPMCHRILTYASSMAAHMRIHTGDRPYSCGQCDRKFTTKANRDRHEATHVGLKPFKCMDCEKSFTEKRSLKIHMRSHTGERPFVCTICNQGFAQKCTLLVHMDRHTNKKGHLCDLCGKAFRQKCQLDIHVKRHKRQANYPCTQCAVKCYTKGDLMRHMIKHTGERPFQCSLCSRTFTRKQYLMDHENTHYGRKPYKCSICTQAFHDMGSCHRHLRKHRQEEEEEMKAGKSKKITSLFSTEEFNLILKGSQTGQLLTLEDGTKAIIKAVESEADGSVVYHISCVGNDFVAEDVKIDELDSSAALPPSDSPTLNSTEDDSQCPEPEGVLQ